MEAAAPLGSAGPGRAGGGGAPCGGRRVPAGPGRGRLRRSPQRSGPRRRLRLRKGESLPR